MHLRTWCAQFLCKCNAVHVSLFSLPNQPNRNDKSFEDLLLEAGLGEGQSVGIAGWKNFTSEADDGKNMYDIPAYMVESIRSVIGRRAGFPTKRPCT